MKILGLSAFHRDSAAALLVDGELVAATQEQNFTRRLHDSAFPRRAARFCLDAAGLRAQDLDHVVYYEKPLKKFERLLASQLRGFPRSAKVFSRSMFLWLGDRLWVKNRIMEELEVSADVVGFVEHQLAHAAVAFYPSPFEQAAILALDDVGEWATTLLGEGTTGQPLRVFDELRFPHSLGLFLSAFTQFLGLEPGRDEVLVEALAAHGSPSFLDELRVLLGIQDDGSPAVDHKYFRFSFDNDRLFDESLEGRLGPARHSGMALDFRGESTRHADLAASVQQHLEDCTQSLVARLRLASSSDKLCVTGFLAQNRRLIQHLVEQSGFSEVWVALEPDKAGAALGAALFAHHQRNPQSDRQRLTSLAFGEVATSRSEEATKGLETAGAVREVLVESLSQGKPVGWVRGAQELGGLSRGHRSILGDPRPSDGARRLLQSLGAGEDYRPCEILISKAWASRLLRIGDAGSELLSHGLSSAFATDDLRRFAPSAVQPDGRVWPLVVAGDRDPELAELLDSFEKQTGVPVLLHGSLQLRGTPLVRNEADAVEAFQRSQLECLVVERALYRR